MPAAAPKKTGGEAAAASRTGPKFNANAPKLNVASAPSGAATAGAAKAAASKTAPKFNPSAPKIDLKSKTAPAKAAGTKFNPNAPKILNQDVDIFDIIKGHLLDEGFAATEEAAMAIQANMSEEWRQSIIESGYFPTPESQREDEKKYNLSRDRLPGEHKPQKPQKPQSQKPGM